MTSRTTFPDNFPQKLYVMSSPINVQKLEENVGERVTTSFVTKDSGKHEEYSTGMQRDTERGKPRFTLLFPKILPYAENLIVRFAELMGRGADKYKTRNWESAATPEELERYLSSAFRHFVQWQEAMTGPCDCKMDELGDRDDSCELHSEDHAAAVLFNIMGTEYVKWRIRNGK